jgi:anti-sigma factor RsiW
MINTNRKLSPDDLEALLPWHAAGTLNSRDADEVEKALAGDKELARRFALARDEMTETILLNEALGAPSARVMENLFKAIDKERKGVRSPAAASGLGAWLADLFTPRVLAFAASAAAVIIMLQAGVIGKMVLQEHGGGSFETASAPPSMSTRSIDLASFALVRFAPQANIADITRFLDSRGAVIVDGPRPGGTGGMYRVRVARSYLAKDELDRVVKEFQSASNNLVSFAAPTE